MFLQWNVSSVECFFSGMFLQWNVSSFPSDAACTHPYEVSGSVLTTAPSITLRYAPSIHLFLTIKSH